MAAQVEHGQGDQGFGWSESERDPGEEPDLGVDRFDPAVGQAVLDGGEDARAVCGDPLAEDDEGFDPAAACPGDPSIQGLDCLVMGKLEDQAKAFFEEIGAVQAGVGLGDPLQLDALVLGQVSGFFHSAQRARLNPRASPIAVRIARP